VSFFFSSRRRHTRSKRDWSSDVCSSDLTVYTTADRSATKSPSTGERLSARGDRHRVDVHHRVRAPASGVAASLSRREGGRAEQRSEERRVGKEGGSGVGGDP